MIDVEILRQDPNKVKELIGYKNADPALVDEFLRLDTEWRTLTKEADDLRAKQNLLSKERKIEEAKANKERIKEIGEKITKLDSERVVIWKKIPNLPSEDTPIGIDEALNKVIRKVGKPTEFDFKPKDHLTLGENLGLLDTETAGKISGTRFGYWKGELVQMQFALIQYCLEIMTNTHILKSNAETVRTGYSAKIFTPVLPPVMIRPEVMDKMARLEPKEERYYIPGDDLYLVGSAEHTLGPMHMDKIIPEEELPLRYVGYSTAFRREAGSYGKDTRGVLRVHQFDKLEFESFTTPEEGIAEQNFLVALQEYITWSLELPYQIIICSTGDQGDPDMRHLDLETWMPSENKYRETHSADYMADYQSRRLNIRIRRKDGSLVFAHMNDATCFAQRTLIAIMENYQTEDGKIRVPKILQRHVGKEVIG
ncbi:MAG: serine--tRNA ligase [Candidatus Liptonbacteria bacterium]